MLLNIRLDGRALHQWHFWLLERLAQLTEVRVTASIVAPPPPDLLPSRPQAIDWLFALEKRLHRLPANGLSAAANATSFQPYLIDNGTPDVVLDLTGSFTLKETQVWHLAFDDKPGEIALLGCLIDGRPPVATVRSEQAVLAAGRLGTESPGVLVASFEDCLARSITLILAAVRGNANTLLPALPGAYAAPPVRPITMPLVATMAVKELSHWAMRAIYRLGYRTPHWQVGWLKNDGVDTICPDTMLSGDWTYIEDDGTRFYADPFPILVDGAVTLFVEDFIHDQGKGIISAVRFDAHGPIGKPEPVLECPYHLSYPYVFEQDGEIWMIPESNASGSIDLYRSTKFPGGWVKETTLVSGVVASDATLLHHGGRWWLFATVQDDGGSFSDALHLWSSDDFRGPWMPHARNPVLIDIASARPAGRFALTEGRLIRPVQDCRFGYGNALGIAEVRKLDDDGFVQEISAIITPPPRRPRPRLHTFNSAGGFAFIDRSALAPRGLLRRL